MKSFGVFGWLSHICALVAFFVVTGGNPLYLSADTGSYQNIILEAHIRASIEENYKIDATVINALAEIDAIENGIKYAEYKPEEQGQEGDDAPADIKAIIAQAEAEAQLDEPDESREESASSPSSQTFDSVILSQAAEAEKEVPIEADIKALDEKVTEYEKEAIQHQAETAGEDDDFATGIDFEAQEEDAAVSQKAVAIPSLGEKIETEIISPTRISEKDVFVKTEAKSLEVDKSVSGTADAEQEKESVVAEIEAVLDAAEADDMPAFDIEEQVPSVAELREQFPPQVKAPDPEALRLTSEGIKFYHGKGVEKDYKKAEELFLKAAELNGASAQYTLGYMYQTGQGVEKDLTKASKWYKAASRHNYSLPQYAYAHMLYTGQGQAENHKEAAKWYIKAAEQEDALPEHYFTAAVLYDNGDGVTQDFDQAAKWYAKAADADHPQAQLCLADMYFRGQGVPQDYRKSLMWYRRAEALGNVQSQFSLGMLYYNGDSRMPRNYQKAAEWFKKAADKNFPPAQFSLGVMYENGYGFTQDYEQALFWYEKASDNKYPKAMYRIAMMYLNGSLGKERNEQLAIEWFQKAFELGGSESAFAIGVIYENGEGGIPKDYRKAVQWYKKSANAGYAKAQHRLGVMYDNGLGVTRDLKEAAKWHEMAADVYSQQRFAGMSYNGIEVEKDFDKAFRWYEAAARNGNIYAQYNLAVMYFNGHGVEKNDIQAYAWMSLVAAQGEDIASRQLSFIKERMSPDQLIEAEIAFSRLYSEVLM